MPPLPTSDPDPSRATAPSAEEKQEEAMKPTPDRTLSLLTAYASILSRIRSSLPSSSTTSPPRLICVSKLKPASDILALHHPAPELLQKATPSTLQELPTAVHFGENYVQELQQKSRLLPPSIRWHFIGGLQSNKCVSLARDVRGLWAVESVDSQKKAKLLDQGWGERKARKAKAKAQDRQAVDAHEEQDAEEEEEEEKLRVFIQVNTSGEESKSGVEPDLPPPNSHSNSNTDVEIDENKHPLLSLAHFIHHSCPHLHLQGLMTIGAIARSHATTKENENEDFTTLRTVRAALAPLLKFDEGTLELSMGMSEDFEAAVRQGSSEVRVGSTIFGARPPKNEAKVLEGVVEGREEATATAAK